MLIGSVIDARDSRETFGWLEGGCLLHFDEGVYTGMIRRTGRWVKEHRFMNSDEDPEVEMKALWRA